MIWHLKITPWIMIWKQNVINISMVSMCSIMLCAIETDELYTYFTTLLSASRYISNRKIFNGYSCLRLWQLLWIMRLIIDSCRAALLSRTAAHFKGQRLEGRHYPLCTALVFRWRVWNTDVEIRLNYCRYNPPMHFNMIHIEHAIQCVKRSNI